jgi:tetratricopeptide (TPR) repeat protein
LKVKNNASINGENKVELLERILKLECMEKTNANHNNHENERSRMNLKWTVLTECGIWYRKLDFYEKAIQYFDKVRLILCNKYSNV